jgi:hypothetical protein
MASLVFFSTGADAMRVRILAGTRLEGRADRTSVSARGVVVRGTLRDDVGHPVPDNHVSITFYDEANAKVAAMLPGSPRPCVETTADGHRDPHVAPDEYVVDTDALGSFCLETTLPLERGTMKLSFGGSSLYDATSAEVPFDLTLPSVALAFDPEPSIASLDRPVFSVGLRVTAPHVSKQGWRIVLKDERDRVLGAGKVDPDGLVRIDLPTEALADPGPGRISANLEGSSLLTQTISHAIERHARVDLKLAAPDPHGVPDDGIPVEVVARCARGSIASGSVEATIAGQTVGAASVRSGRAALVATFAGTRERIVPASIRYLSDAPWWEPGAPLSIVIGVEAPSPWRRAPSILLAFAVALWMTRTSWLPRLLRLRSPSRGPVRSRELPSPAVLVQRTLYEGWSGRVVDAHDGSPIVGARVSIVVPTFPGSGDDTSTSSEVVTDATGHFVLSPNSPGGKAILRVSAPWHATLENPLPPPSELSIPLVARRRRLLDRLVAWASREWGPWQGSRDPTPAEVASRARLVADRLGAERSADVQTWARAVEQAAFGEAPVDEHAENSVASLEPTPGRTSLRPPFPSKPR